MLFSLFYFLSQCVGYRWIGKRHLIKAGEQQCVLLTSIITGGGWRDGGLDGFCEGDILSRGTREITCPYTLGAFTPFGPVPLERVGDAVTEVWQERTWSTKEAWKSLDGGMVGTSRSCLETGGARLARAGQLEPLPGVGPLTAGGVLTPLTTPQGAYQCRRRERAPLAAHTSSARPPQRLNIYWQEISMTPSFKLHIQKSRARVTYVLSNGTEDACSAWAWVGWHHSALNSRTVKFYCWRFRKGRGF